MGWSKKLGGALKKFGAGLINPTLVGGSLMDAGTQMIAGKYASDLQGHENDRMRQYNLDMTREMFEKQVAENQRVFGQNVAREDAVWEREKAYNLDLWNKQNEYNSPAAQMQRLSDAGLNPNLMYGQGTTGIAAAIPAARTAPAGAEPARTDVPSYGETVPKGKYVMDALGNYVSIRNANLMAQNMSVQNDLIRSQDQKTQEERDRVRAEIDRIREETRGLRRENDLMIRSGFSKFDPWQYRIGGRAMDWIGRRVDQSERNFDSMMHTGGRALKYLRNKATGIWSDINDVDLRRRAFDSLRGLGYRK